VGYTGGVMGYRGGGNNQISLRLRGEITFNQKPPYEQVPMGIPFSIVSHFGGNNIGQHFYFSGSGNSL
jgi:hypothetical protein